MVTRGERRLLASLPDQEDGGEYYCDIEADYRMLLRLEGMGLADSRDRSDWWRTPAGAAAADARVSPVLPLRAVRFDARTVVCGIHFIVDDDPVGQLCQALVRDGAPDNVLAVVRFDLVLDQSVASIHQAARAAAARDAQASRGISASGAGPPAAAD